MRLYFACLISAERLFAAGTPVIAHGQPKAYYELLMSAPGPSCLPNLSARRYDQIRNHQTNEGFALQLSSMDDVEQPVKRRRADLKARL